MLLFTGNLCEAQSRGPAALWSPAVGRYLASNIAEYLWVLSVVLGCDVSCWVVLCCVGLYCVVMCRVGLCCVVLCCVVFCCFGLGSVALCCVWLCIKACYFISYPGLCSGWKHLKGRRYSLCIFLTRCFILLY